MKQTNREKALAALLATRSVVEASQESGIGLRTLHRYLEDQEFSREYRRLRDGLVENAVAQIQGCLADAADALRRNLNCEQHAVEVRTALGMFDLALKNREINVTAEAVEIIKEHKKGREGFRSS